MRIVCEFIHGNRIPDDSFTWSVLLGFDCFYFGTPPGIELLVAGPEAAASNQGRILIEKSTSEIPNGRLLIEICSVLWIRALCDSMVCRK